MKKYIVILTLNMFIIGCQCDDWVDFTGKVIDSETKLAIPKASILFNSTEDLNSDSSGIFSGQLNLCGHLADSLSFYVSKEGYFDNDYGAIIGNTQKDIFIIEMKKR